jgi:isopentenyldiphosphate isomerase
MRGTSASASTSASAKRISPRRLAEELGVSGVRLERLGDVVAAKVELPARAIDDRELQQTFTGRYDGPIRMDRSEVADVRRVDRATLSREILSGKDLFTPWLRTRLERLGWL